jgi:hypothetical protein
LRCKRRKQLSCVVGVELAFGEEEASSKSPFQGKTACDCASNCGLSSTGHSSQPKNTSVFTEILSPLLDYFADVNSSTFEAGTMKTGGFSWILVRIESGEKCTRQLS